MIERDEYELILKRLRALPPLNGWRLDDHIEWSETAAPPESARQFALEAIYVICNSGMKHTIARRIYEQIEVALSRGEPVCTAARTGLGLPAIFGHYGKSAAIDAIWAHQQAYFDGYMRAEDKIAFCGTIPHIGEITKNHLAKNFGADVAKPDVHLQRLADQHGTTPQALCEHLAAIMGCKARTVDLVLWMACARKVIDSNTGAMSA